MNRSILHRVLREVEGLTPAADSDSDAGLLLRFAKSRDETAFTALLRRHGPMVWAVCRHLLPGHADAEDAFQATFLALVRSAQSIRDGNAVGGWLHGVAVRIATQAKRSAARRKQRERRSSVPETDRAVPEATWESLLAAVHEEVRRLPDSLRTAFVLCDLEGVRQPDAAARLGWKPGTLTGRLSKARQLLLQRLESRGLAPLLACGSAGLGVATAGAAVPLDLMDRVMSLTVAGGAVPPAVLQLVREVTPMALNRTKLAAAAVLVAGGLAAGIGPALIPLVQAQPPGAGSADRPAARTRDPIPATDPFRPTTSSPSPSRALPGGGPGTPGKSSLGSAVPEGMGEGGDFGMEAPASRPASPYRYAAKPRSVVAFAGLLRNFAQEGWEYVGETEYSGEELLRAARRPNDLINNLEPGASALLIFKRATRTAARSATSGMSIPAAMGGAMGAAPGLPGPAGGPSGPRGERRTGGPGPLGGPSYPAGGAGPMPGLSALEAPAFSGSPTPSYEVIRLKSGKAQEIARVLGEVFQDRRNTFRVVADPTSNSIIVVANKADLTILKGLLERLEEQR